MRIDYKNFGSICANSSTLTNLSDVFHLNNNELDIKKLFANGRAIIGHLQKNHHKLIQVSIYEKSNSVIYCAKCDKIQIWQETTAIDVSTLSWAYIDTLSLLANNIRVQSIAKNE